MTLHDLWVALALMAVIEGLFYAAFPHRMRRMMAQVSQQPPDLLRLSGLALAMVGLGVLWLLVRLQAPLPCP